MSIVNDNEPYGHVVLKTAKALMNPEQLMARIAEERRVVLALSPQGWPEDIERLAA